VVSVTDPYGRILAFRDWIRRVLIHKKRTELRGLSSRVNYTERPPLVGEVRDNFCR
jgi:hypothetical protein